MEKVHIVLHSSQIGAEGFRGTFHMRRFNEGSYSHRREGKMSHDLVNQCLVKQLGEIT